MKPVPTKKRKERGSALLEGAFVSMMFFLILLGMLDFGQFLFIHQILTERARAGVRYGIVNNPSDSTSIQNMILYGSPTGSGAGGGVGNNPPSGTDTGIFNLQRSQINVSTSGSGTQDYQLKVQLQNYQYQIYSPFIHGTYQGPNITVSMPLGINF